MGERVGHIAVEEFGVRSRSEIWGLWKSCQHILAGSKDHWCGELNKARDNKHNIEGREDSNYSGFHYPTKSRFRSSFIVQIEGTANNGEGHHH